MARRVQLKENEEIELAEIAKSNAIKEPPKSADPFTRSKALSEP